MHLHCIDSLTSVVHVTNEEQPFGGYTVYCSQRPDGKVKVSLCQCNNKKEYNGEVGTTIARSRQQRGQYFVLSQEEVVSLVSTLEDKLPC